MQPIISIIIPTKDRHEIFFQTLNSICEAVKSISSEIIVINDSKTSAIKLPVGYEHVRVIDNPKSGVASARNLGVKHASANLLLFMDDDILISKSNISDILNAHEKHPYSAINLNWEYPPELITKIMKTQFGRFLIKYGFTTSKGWYNHPSWSDQAIFESYGIASFFLLLPKPCFETAGGYDERFPHAGAEDFDFARRVTMAGVKSYINPLSKVYHNEADRNKIKPWLIRLGRSGETRKVACLLGYNEMEIKHGKIKTITYMMLSRIKPFVLFSLVLVPNYKLFDPIYFKITNLLLGTYLYEGFNSRKNI